MLAAARRRRKMIWKKRLSMTRRRNSGHSLLLFKADVPAPLVCNYI